MSYLGDLAVGATLNFFFTTRRFSTGAPYTLAGTPALGVYNGNSTTEDDSGITLDVDFDGRTGLNHVRIDLSSDGTFYAAGSNCAVVITAGTVDSVSVVGEVVAQFSISSRPVQGLASGVVTAAAIATGAVDADALATDAVNAIADGLLNRDMATGTDSGSSTVRTVRQALRFLRNKWSISGGTLTVCKEDDSTASWTAAVTTTAGDPVSAADPAGP
jgi:hypothetical protein